MTDVKLMALCRNTFDNQTHAAGSCLFEEAKRTAFNASLVMVQKPKALNTVLPLSFIWRQMTTNVSFHSVACCHFIEWYQHTRMAPQDLKRCNRSISQSSSWVSIVIDVSLSLGGYACLLLLCIKFTRNTSKDNQVSTFSAHSRS